MITHVLAFDPSGNFNEGKGTTGWVLIQIMPGNKTEKLVARGIIKATDYKSQEDYWNAHIDLLDYNIKRHKKNLMVVIEDYILYENRTDSQINSQFETCRLIGILQWFCWKNNQKYILETASQVKSRWSDYILSERGVTFMAGNKHIHAETGLVLNIHVRDALRHALHFIYCKNKPKKTSQRKQQIEHFSNYIGDKYEHNKYNAGRRS